jgi:hypothetical protein
VGDAVHDIWKTLTHKTVKNAFQKQGHAHRWEFLELWLRDVTTEQIHRNNIVERSLRWMRTGFTVSKLGWNVGVGLLQTLGILQSSVRLGHENMLWALYTVLKSNPIGKDNIYKHVQSQSGMMAGRQESFNRDIVEAKQQMRFTALDKITPGKSAKFVKETLFWMIRTLQEFTDTVTWLAAHKKFMQEFKGNQQKAIRAADRIVIQSQASGIFGERTPVERGSIAKQVGQTELVRAFSLFMSYFMAKTNVAITQTKQTNFKHPGEVLKWVRDMAMLYTVEAMAAAFIRNQVPDEDDSDETVLGFTLRETGNTIMAGVPFIREVSSELSGFRGGGLTASISETFGRAVSQISQEEWDEALLKSLNNLFGVFLKYPSSQLNKSVGAILKSMEGEDVKAIEFVMGKRI